MLSMPPMKSYLRDPPSTGILRGLRVASKIVEPEDALEVFRERIDRTNKRPRIYAQGNGGLNEASSTGMIATPGFLRM